MPSEETGDVTIFLRADGILVKFVVVRVLESNILQSFKGSHRAVANNLYLRLMRDRLQVRVEHGALRIECFTMTIAISGGVKESSDFILSVWSKSLLVLEEYDAVFVKGTSDDFKIRLCTSSDGTLDKYRSW
jgi:hypothetical protein